MQMEAIGGDDVTPHAAWVTVPLKMKGGDHGQQKLVGAWVIVQYHKEYYYNFHIGFLHFPRRILGLQSRCLKNTSNRQITGFSQQEHTQNG
jgi:hypothetical protein